MNLDLYAELENCYYLCRKLRARMEQDMEPLSACLKGDIYDELAKNTENALESVRRLEKEILILQEEQLL